MRRGVASFCMVILLIGLLSSCKSHERCPAYSKADKQEMQDRS